MNKKAWMEIGRQNIWIKHAEDPPFTETSIHECETLAELEERIGHGNWCLGQGFSLGDLCFINQVDGGDEWLSIKEDLPFDSYTFGGIIRRGEFKALINSMLMASKEDCKAWNY